jgi:hypothetical protein
MLHRLTQPLGRTGCVGLKTPNAVIILTSRDQAGAVKTFTLRVGDQDDKDNSFVVISSESPYFVRAGIGALQDFVEKGRDYFLQLPPTPAE